KAAYHLDVGIEGLGVLTSVGSSLAGSGKHAVKYFEEESPLTSGVAFIEVYSDGEEPKFLAFLFGDVKKTGLARSTIANYSEIGRTSRPNGLSEIVANLRYLVLSPDEQINV